MFSNDECIGWGVWENKKLRYDRYFKNGKRDGEGVEIFRSDKYDMKNPSIKICMKFQKWRKRRIWSKRI